MQDLVNPQFIDVYRSMEVITIVDGLKKTSTYKPTMTYDMETYGTYKAVPPVISWFKNQRNYGYMMYLPKVNIHWSYCHIKGIIYILTYMEPYGDIWHILV